MLYKKQYPQTERYVSLAGRVSRRDATLTFPEFSDFFFLAVTRFCAVSYTPQFMGSIMLTIQALTSRWAGQTVPENLSGNIERLVQGLLASGKKTQAYDVLDLCVDFAFELRDYRAVRHFLDKALDIYDTQLPPSEKDRRQHSHESMQSTGVFINRRLLTATPAEDIAILTDAETAAIKAGLSELARTAETGVRVFRDQTPLDGLLD